MDSCKMFYLVEFECDNTIDILQSSNLIFENEEAEIGEKVSAVYTIRKKKKLYEAKVVSRSDDYDALKKEMEAKLGLEEEDVSELGRGKRLKRKRADSTSDTADDPEVEHQAESQSANRPTHKKIKTKSQAQKMQKIETAKEIIKEIYASQQPHQHHNIEHLIQENSNLKTENKKLSSENKRLRRERSEALDVGKLLQTAVSLVEGLKRVGVAGSSSSSQQQLSIAIPSPRPLSSSPSPTAPHHYSLPPAPKPYTPLLSISSSPPHSTPRSYSTPSPAIVQDPAADPAVVDVLGDDAAFVTSARAIGSGSEQLLFDGTEPNVVRLAEGFSIYVLKSAKEGLIHHSKNQTTAVRSGLRAVFRDDALADCSVKGGVAKGPMGKPEERRKALCPEGVKALMSFSQELAEQKGWKKATEKDLVAAMGTKLSETRAAAAKISGNKND